ncbi:MAG: ComEC/Rec2 family competence protein [Flavobacteriales bacterium]
MAKVFLHRFNYDNFYVWDAMPMFKMVLLFIAGLIAGSYLNFPWLLALFLVGIILLIPYFPRLLSAQRRIKFIRLFNLLFVLSIFFFGIGVYDLHTRCLVQFVNANASESEILAAGLISSEVSNTRSGKAFNLQVIQSDQHDLDAITPLSIRVFIRLDSSISFNYGDLLNLRLKLSPLPRPNNPGEFDYGKYLKADGIHYVAYCTADDIISLEKAFRKDIRYYAFQCRDFLEKQFIKGGLRDNELGIADALLLGKRSEISKDLMSAFSGAGTVHILAVSGLHVGMLYGVLVFLLGFLKPSKWLFFILVISVLWTYAFITGLSPSVLRATVMFSFIGLGNLVSRKAHVINSLAASAFFLLLFNPNLLYKVGFQLSYLAVLGIVCLQPYFARLWEPRNKVLNYSWQLITVSVAAQLVTAPIGMLYFHQFPNYFILANLFAIPLAFLIVLNGIIVFVVSPVSFLLTATTFTLNWLIKALNYLINMVSSLPGAVSNNIYFDFQLTFFFYIILILIFVYAATREKSIFSISLGVTCIFLALNIIQKLQNNNNELLYVLHDKNEILIGIGRQEKFLWQSLLAEKTQAISSSVINIGLSSYPKLEQVDFHVASNNGIRLFGAINKSIAVIEDTWSNIECGEKIMLDYCILSGNPKVNTEALLSCIQCNEWIFTANNTHAYIRKMRKSLEDLGVVSDRVFNIKESGYFAAQL